MSDNVIKFRRIEKPPEQKPVKKPPSRGWLPWVVLLALALLIYGVQQSQILSGVFGGP